MITSLQTVCITRHNVGRYSRNIPGTTSLTHRNKKPQDISRPLFPADSEVPCIVTQSRQSLLRHCILRLQLKTYVL